MKKFTRVLLMGDPHCGHLSGLTPKKYQLEVRGEWTDYARQQRTMWDWYVKTLKSLQPIDICVMNGDGIDGKQTKAGGVQLITSDRIKQTDILLEVLQEVKAKEYYQTYGTSYHCGQEEDFEKIITRELKTVKISPHLMLKVRDTIFDIKHKVGGSGLEHTRFTPLAKERIQNLLWVSSDGQPESNVIVRSHTHRYGYCGGAGYHAVVLPCLMGFGDKYGSRECGNVIDIGVVCVDVYDKNVTEPKAKLMTFETVQNGRIIESRIK